MPSPPALASFSPKERAFIRHVFSQFFTTLPPIAERIRLRTWRAGALKGQPKIPPALQSTIERGFVEVPPMQHGFRASCRKMTCTVW